ncbi:uncharacterized protein IWZ02DRAFT_38803 [Phyllosticta citriasiana]|uniref:uncharacterized protein n=1 Tax=Phyllosticta citriasiana TaxID=595635 RepID=UPI0030FDEE4C
MGNSFSSSNPYGGFQNLPSHKPAIFSSNARIVPTFYRPYKALVTCIPESIVEIEVQPTLFLQPYHVRTNVEKPTILSVDADISVQITNAPTMLDFLVTGSTVSTGTATGTITTCSPTTIFQEDDGSAATVTPAPDRPLDVPAVNEDLDLGTYLTAPTEDDQIYTIETINPTEADQIFTIETINPTEADQIFTIQTIDPSAPRTASLATVLLSTNTPFIFIRPAATALAIGQSSESISVPSSSSAGNGGIVPNVPASVLSSVVSQAPGSIRSLPPTSLLKSYVSQVTGSLVRSSLLTSSPLSSLASQVSQAPYSLRNTLPAPSVLSSVASQVSQVPGSVRSSLPATSLLSSVASQVSQVPASIRSSLPASSLLSSVVSQVPSTLVRSTLAPASFLKSVLSQAPASSSTTSARSSSTSSPSSSSSSSIRSSAPLPLSNLAPAGSTITSAASSILATATASASDSLSTLKRIPRPFLRHSWAFDDLLASLPALETVSGSLLSSTARPVASILPAVVSSSVSTSVPAFSSATSSTSSAQTSLPTIRTTLTRTNAIPIATTTTTVRPAAAYVAAYE